MKNFFQLLKQRVWDIAVLNVIKIYELIFLHPNISHYHIIIEDNPNIHHLIHSTQMKNLPESPNRSDGQLVAEGLVIGLRCERFRGRILALSQRVDTSIDAVHHMVSWTGRALLWSQLIH